MFMQVLEILPVGILISHQDDLLYVNKSMMTLLEYNQDTSNILEDFQSIMSKCNGQPNFEIKYKSKSLLVANKLIENQNSLSVVADVSAIKSLHTKEVEEKFKRQMVMLFMHEFKTPLNWLGGILSSIIPDQSTQKLLKMARHATNLLNLYVDDMVFYNQKEDQASKAPLKYFDVLHSVKECIGFVSSDLNMNGICCTVSSKGEFKSTYLGNSVRYKQIINNILCNSIKSCKANEGSIVISVESNGSSLVTEISDNGTTLSECEINLLLNPIEYMSKDSTEIRFGLGMVLCKDMCKRVNGEFVIYTANGKNYYKILLPFELGMKQSIDRLNVSHSIDYSEINEEFDHLAEEIIAHKAVKRLDTVLVGRQILIVDDTPFNNIMIKHMLKILKVGCTSCTNGKEAVDMFAKQGVTSAYSMILMDVNMPVMNGIDATREIKAIMHTECIDAIPIIMLSAQGDHEIIQRASDAGADEYSNLLISH